MSVTLPRVAAAAARKVPGLDAIGHDRVLGPVQALDALDGDHLGSVAADARAHLDEAVREIDHLGLARGVLEQGLALGKAGGHHQVLGAGDRHRVHEDARALQPLRGRVDVARLDRDLRAHRREALDVQVHGALADGAAAGQRHPCLPEARRERAQREDRCAHRLHQVVARDGQADLRGVEVHGARGHGRLHAHALQECHHRAHVVQVRHVRHAEGIRGEQRRGEDGQCRILRPGDADLAGERCAALD
jgi:hypothetical protein